MTNRIPSSPPPRLTVALTNTTTTTTIIKTDRTIGSGAEDGASTMARPVTPNIAVNFFAFVFSNELDSPTHESDQPDLDHDDIEPYEVENFAGDVAAMKIMKKKRRQRNREACLRVSDEGDVSQQRRSTRW
ncbi:hypothetical protein PIB30_050012 [Stylosanthes scabra]|uniref:Uncharacterized protein n=1 Tax=Stylosanthes scabra TaxID=79078 RepID=A0ABU6UI86_9FABA|nr:hypothetical protein [Stylosanthes scabra]